MEVEVLVLIHPGHIGSRAILAAPHTGEHQGIRVIAIGTIQHVVSRLRTRADRDGRITEAIAIRIGMPVQEEQRIDEVVRTAIAVVVQAIAAYLRGGGVHLSIGVITIHRATARDVVEPILVHVQATTVGGTEPGDDHEAAVGLLQRVTQQAHRRAVRSTGMQRVGHAEELGGAHVQQTATKVDRHLQEMGGSTPLDRLEFAGYNGPLPDRQREQTQRAGHHGMGLLVHHRSLRRTRMHGEFHRQRLGREYLT